MSLLIKTPILLDWISILTITFTLDYLLMGSLSKYSHISGLVLQQMNCTGVGNTIQYIVDVERGHEAPESETKDLLTQSPAGSTSFMFSSFLPRSYWA